MITNKSTAYLFLVISILGAFFIKGSYGLNRLYSETEKIFYNGVAKNIPSLDYDLNKRAEYGYNYVTVAKSYIPDDEAVKQLETAILDLRNAKTIHDKYIANQKISDYSAQVFKKLDSLSLSEKDTQYKVSIYQNLVGRQDIIVHNEYNKYAEKFNDELEKMPAVLLKTIGLVKPAERFGV